MLDYPSELIKMMLSPDVSRKFPESEPIDQCIIALPYDLGLGWRWEAI
jgi:hypothetical protein